MNVNNTDDMVYYFHSKMDFNPFILMAMQTYVFIFTHTYIYVHTCIAFADMPVR